MLFDSQVDEPARPCTLLVSTYTPGWSTTAVGKYTVIKASTAQGIWQPGSLGCKACSDGHPGAGPST